MPVKFQQQEAFFPEVYIREFEEDPLILRSIPRNDARIVLGNKIVVRLDI